MSRGAAVAVGWLADRLFGEPATPKRPVAWFGKTMRRLEKVTYRDSRAAGVIHALSGLSIALLTGTIANRVLGGSVATVTAVYVCVAGRMLEDEARGVIDAVERGDLDAARERLPSLVGRDPSDLDRDEIIRAVIESVAENTVDAVLASLFWASVGGAPAVLAHRAINTLDAMVGHRSEKYLKFGWASARLDDLANYLPARLGAAGVILLKSDRCAEIWRAVTRDAPNHPSPNGGVIEAAVAAALDVRVGGINRYGDLTEDRGTLGGGNEPTVEDAHRAVSLVGRLDGLAAAVVLLRR